MLKSSLLKYFSELAKELLLELPQNEKKKQALYKENKEMVNVASIEEEAEGIVDSVNSEMRCHWQAQLFLVKGVAKSNKGNSNAQSKGGNLDHMSVNVSHVADPNKKFKWIQIPKFSGNKMKYSSWWVAFSSCVDETSLSLQF